MIYRFGNYELDAPRCELCCAGQQVAIEPKVFAVLVYLLQHRDRVVTKEELLEHCWPETFVSEAALTRCLAKVRKTVQSESAGAPVIKTLYGRGDCFVADAVADRIQGIKAGADDFLTKPVHGEELLARIATTLKLKHTVDRRIGELRALKDHFATFVRLVTTPEAPSS